MKLAEFRAQKGLQQKELMKDIGLYSKIENGKALAIESDCYKFAELFGCDVPDLFEEDELNFFKKVLKGETDSYCRTKEFVESEAKIVSCGICKSVKRHIEQLRKCYWLNKTRNEKLKRIITAEGFSTEQAWFNFIVDREIEKAARSDDAEQGGPPIMLQ